MIQPVRPSGWIILSPSKGYVYAHNDILEGKHSEKNQVYV